MRDYKQLNVRIDLAEIFDAISNKQDIDFLATTDDLEIEDKAEYFGGGKIFNAAPIHPPEDVLKLLIANGMKDINSLILYASLQGTKITYSFWKDDLILVEINF